MGPEARAYHEQWINESPEKYQESTRNAIERSADADGVEYAEARRRLDLLRREVRSAFSDIDILVTPTMRNTATPITEPQVRALTGLFNDTGLPAISVPCGFSSTGLPIGLQIVGAPFAETTVLALAHAYEQATGWHLRNPGFV